MPLKKQKVSIPFGKGVNTKVSSKLLPAGQLSVLENAKFSKAGEIQKRNGLTDVDLSGTIATAEKLFSVDDTSLVLSTDGSIYVIQKDWDGIGKGSLGGTGFHYFESEVDGVSRGSIHHQENPSIAISRSGEFLGIAFTSASFDHSGTAINYVYRVCTFDLNKRVFLADEEISTGSAATFPGRIKIASIYESSVLDNKFAVYYEKFITGTDVEIWRATLYPNQAPTGDAKIVDKASASSAATAEYAASTARSFDVYEHSSSTNDNVFIAWTNSDNNLSLAEDNGGTLGTIQEFSAGFAYATSPIAVYRSAAGGTSRVYVSIFGGTAFKIAQALESNLAADKEITTGTITTAKKGQGGFVDSPDGTKVRFYYTDFTSGASLGATMSSVEYVEVVPNDADDGGADPDSSSASAVSFTADTWLPCAPFKANSVAYVPTSTETRDDSDLNTVTWALSDTSILGNTLQSSIVRDHLLVSTPRIVTDGTYQYTVLPKTTTITSFPDGSGGINTATNSVMTLVKMSTALPAHGLSTAQLGSELFIANGTLRSLTNPKWEEHGFHIRPTLTAAATTPATGNLTSAKTYKYKAVFEIEDVAGNIHRSEPSESVSITTATSTASPTALGANITPHYPYTPTNKLSSRIALYRTQAAGAIYNRVATLDNSMSTYSDLISDTNALAGEFLYTEGGELPNTAPISCWYVTAHRNRLFIISENNRIFFTKEYEQTIGPSFVDTFFVPLDGMDHDKPTALASAGGELIIFREESIWSISGDGPDNTGTGSYFTPRLITSSLGALKGTPTLFSQEGLFFQSPKGIHALTAEGPQYLGAPVEDEVGADRIIQIFQDQATETIRFVMSTKILVYNHLFKQWSVDKPAHLSSNTIVGGMLLDGTPHYLLSNRHLLKDSTGFKDSTTYIPLKMKTGWIAVENLQGFQRIYRFLLLGESKDKHVLNVKVYYDYDDSTVVDTYSFTTSSAADANLQFRGHLSKQKCQAIKFEVEDADNSASDGDGYAINEILLEVGLKKGGFRLPTTQTIGAS